MQQTESEGRQASGRWSKEEHQRFMYAIMQYGKDWRRVEQYVKTRSSSQVRSHAQKFFNKLQRAAQGQEGSSQHLPRPQEYSETEFDLEREMNNEQTPSTPMELVSLIRKQTKEDGGKISLSQLKKSLEGQEQMSKKSQEGQVSINKPELISPDKDLLPTSFKSMSNILSAYEEVNSHRETTEQDQSFFISITKKYKKLFKQVEDFDRLIDLHHSTNAPPQEATRHRKRSFTLPEGSNLEEEELDERIEEIKKKMKLEGKEKEKKEKEVKEGEGEGRKKERKERKDSDSSIQFMPPPLNKLTTIQEQPREQQQNLSFRAILSQQRLEENKP